MAVRHVLAVFALALALPPLHGDSPTLPGTPPAALVRADNGLGLSLFRQLRGAHPGRNLLMSPLSVAQALQMTWNGAAGRTLADLTQVLQLTGLAPAEVNQGNAALGANLPGADPKVQVLLGNSLWQKNDVLLPAFRDLTRAYYAAQVGDLGQGPAAVNAWVSQRTNGLIPRIMDPASNCQVYDLLLVNTVYFHGDWAKPFNPANTTAGAFTREDGTQVACPLMFRSGGMGYGADGRTHSGRLPFGDGRYGMIFVQPDTGVSMDAVAASLDGPAWEALVQGLQVHPVRLTLPKWTAAFSTGLAGPLKALGLGAAFDPAHADFSALSAQPQHLSEVVHGTHIAVDEAGVVAAAATSVVVAGNALPSRTLVLDRPFFYAIQDSSSGALLYFGQMLDPAAQ
jgi:serpin B